jgi:hypothetical protein
VDHSQLLQVLETSQKLNSESPYKAIIKTAVVIHLDELVEVNLIEVED